MKILHLIPSFGPGGAERQLSIIALALASTGVECHIGYCSDGPNIKSLNSSAVHLHKIPASGNHDPRLIWHVWSLIRTIKPDIVQTWLLQMDIIGGLVSLFTKIPFVLSERSMATAYPANWKVFLRSRIGMYASLIVANSQGGVDYWNSFRGRVPIRLIRNCISPVDQIPAIEDGIPAENDFILYAGRLSPEKNVLLLLEALIRVVRSRQNCSVVMFGEGPMKTELQQRISDADMSDRIRLHGYSEILSAWLKRADICVSISDFEGNPNVVLEAAVQGCPLVISDIPAHREIFNETSACFVRQNSIVEVSDALLAVLSDKDKRVAKAKQAKKNIAGYSIDHILPSYLSIYADLARQ